MYKVYSTKAVVQDYYYTVVPPAAALAAAGALLPGLEAQGQAALPPPYSLQPY